jgi:hypothetical protein
MSYNNTILKCTIITNGSMAVWNLRTISLSGKVSGEIRWPSLRRCKLIDLQMSSYDCSVIFAETALLYESYIVNGLVSYGGSQSGILAIGLASNAEVIYRYHSCETKNPQTESYLRIFDTLALYVDSVG